MIIGTTPTHEFTIPPELMDFKELHIIYAQGERVLFVKTKEDCEILENVVSVQLTQHETFRFDPEKDVNIQVRLLIGNNVLSSMVTAVKCYKCLESEILE